MKSLILYDSLYGNTQKVAEAIAAALNSKGSVTSLKVSDFKTESLKQVGLLIIGTPVHGGQPSQPTQAFLASLSPNSLTGIKVAAFDTRFDIEKQNMALRLLMKTIGYAAPRLLHSLSQKGGQPLLAEGFIVNGKEGPLAKNELDRATAWAKQLYGMLD